MKLSYRGLTIFLLNVECRSPLTAKFNVYRWEVIYNRELCCKWSITLNNLNILHTSPDKYSFTVIYVYDCKWQRCYGHLRSFTIFILQSYTLIYNLYWLWFTVRYILRLLSITVTYILKSYCDLRSHTFLKILPFTA